MTPETSPSIQLMKSRNRLLHIFPIAIAAIGITPQAASAAYSLVNGDFEDTSGTFPTGWTGSASDAGGFASGSHDALLTSGNSITQDFSGDPRTIATAENYDFQLDFAFRTSALSTTSDQRFRLRDNNNAGDLITLGFETAATGGGTALSYFSGGWNTAIDAAFTAGTTYYIRVIGSDLDLASRSYTIGYSTNGVDYTTSGDITGFHAFSPGVDFETIRFEAGTSTLRIDAVSVVPEPSIVLLGGLGVLGLLRRRR